MSESQRRIAREIAARHLQNEDPLGWFEDLYKAARGNVSIIPWADLIPNPNLLAWLDKVGVIGHGKRALKVGCGLGDDAEELRRRGFSTTAFDISHTAIDWCKQRFPASPVDYVAEDLFNAPRDWKDGFDFVLESYTLQVLPPNLRPEAMRHIAAFVSLGGILLVIARGRDPVDPAGKMPWPLTKNELDVFRTSGLKEINFEDYIEDEDPPVRRFRATYLREDTSK